jgi:glutamate-1-semialdehyde aminotransferase
MERVSEWFNKIKPLTHQRSRAHAISGVPAAETQLADLIIDAVKSIEMVRMVSSGTEAAMSAIGLARGYTRRDVIVKFAGVSVGSWVNAPHWRGGNELFLRKLLSG